jgi:hypothetical protein
MGRPPVGKVAMTGAERMRLHRLKHGTRAPVTKQRAPVTKHPVTKSGADVASLQAELAQAKARLAEVEQMRDTALAEHATVLKMLEDGHRAIVQAKAILAAKGIMPAEMRKTLRHALHEDRTTDPTWKVRYKAAFQFIDEHERALFKKPLPPRPASLPRTAEEWEAMKWHAKEERKAKRAAKRAAKANPPKSLGRQ